MRRRLSIIVAVALLAVAAAGVTAAVRGSVTVLATSGGFQLIRTTSGLLTFRPFRQPVSDRRLQDTFEFNGSASASYAYVRDPGNGLRVGVAPHRESDFSGWFAVTLAAFPASSVFHVDMTRPPGNVTGAGNEAETVFAVQTASTKITGLINFVEVSSDSLQGSTAWQVDYSHGRVSNASSDLYWRSAQRRHAPLSYQITVRTDGSHQLTVWFGSRVVFRSDRLHMQMEAPFQPYLEVQALRTGYVARFTNFWVTENDAITVRGLPPGARVSLLPAAPSAGRHPRALAAAVASRSGAATLRLPPPAARGQATLTVTSAGRTLRFGPFGYAGGDRYQLRRTR